jgi:hypothetical protein
VQPVSEEERGLDSFKTRLKDFDKSVKDFLNRGDTHVPDGGVGWKANCVCAAVDEDIDRVEQESTMPEADEYTEKNPLISIFWLKWCWHWGTESNGPKLPVVSGIRMETPLMLLTLTQF